MTGWSDWFLLGYLRDCLHEDGYMPYIFVSGGRQIQMCNENCNAGYKD